MPNWKKVIVSGSDAALNSLYVKTSTNTGFLTASGLIYPAADNGEESFIQTNGTGTLSLQYVKTMYEEIYNGESSNLLKGTPVYVSGSVGAAAVVYRANAGNPSRMPCVYVSADTIAPGATGRGIALGLIKGVDTTGYPAGTEIYLAVGGGWTSVRPTGSAIVQVLGYVTKEGSGGQGLILNPGPASLPNLTTNNVWIGNASSYPTTISTASLFVNSASYALTSSFAVSSSRAVSSSYALSASQAQSSVTATSATSATSAGTATGTSGQLLAKDDRVIEPNSITNAYLQFGFTAWNNNNAGPYADYLHMRSYIDSSGGNDNLVAFNKQQIGMRIWQQSFNSATAYADYRDVVLTSGSSTGYVPLWNGPYAISSSVIYQSGSNIGLGTITPTQRLEVSGNIKLAAGGFLYGDGSSAFLQLTNANGSKLAYGSNVYFEALAASANIRASSENITLFNNNGRIVLSGSGDVGIGTNNPQGALEIVKAITYSSIDTYPQLRIKNATGDTGHQLGFGVETGLSFIQSLNRGIGATPLILQRYAGNVGIGTTTPNALLDVNGNAIVSGSFTVAPSSTVELQVASTGVKIGNTIADSHNVTGSLNTSGSMTLLGTFTQTPFKSIVIPSLSANATQAREFEILRGITDYNDWSPTGVVEIEVHEQQYGRGLKKTYAFSYGYLDIAEFKLVEMIGASTYNNFQLRMGSKTLISGDVYYYPIYAQVEYYTVVDILIKTRRNITTNPVSTTNGDLYVNTAPTAVNISDFTADSIVTLNNAASGVDVTGSLGVSAGITAQNLTVTSTTNLNGTSATFNCGTTSINSDVVIVGNNSTDNVGVAGNTMYFPGNSRVGIGTTTPQNRLDVNGAAAGIISSFGATIANNQFVGLSFGYLETGNSSYRKSALVFERSETHGQGSNASGKIHFLLNNNSNTSATALTDAVLTIDSVGGTAGSSRVGIGTRFPTASLHISGSVASDNLMRVQSSAGAEYFFISASGNVGIGTTSPNARLDVNGSAIITGSLTVAPTAGNVELQVTSTGVNLGNISTDIHNVTGSLRVNGSITGSLLGTASWASNAITASYALTSAGGGTPFPFTGNAVITGSLRVTPYTASGMLIVNDASEFVNAANYTYPQFRLADYRTGVTLVNNDEVQIVTNATATAGFKLSAGIPKMTLDSSAWLQWSTAATNGFTHDVILKRESASTLAITGSVKVNSGVTGSLLGTASYATQALSASWAPGGSSTISFNRQTASYTLVLADAGKVVEMNVGSANNLTVPLNSSVAYPVGTEITVTQYGAGRTTIVATSGVTLRSVNSWLKANGQYSVIGLLKVATDEWYVYGNLSA